MTKADQESYRGKLQAMRARLTGDVMLLTESLQSPHAESQQTNESEEMGNDSFEQDVTIEILRNEEGVLSEINMALNRLDAGRYGVCERCEKPIPKLRLNAIPYARYCVPCAEAVEAGE